MRQQLTPGPTLLWLLAACLSLTLCCGAPERPNVIIVGLDAVRADHLGCYGYGRPTSPNIDELAHEGALFTRAVSQSSWTLPSFGSLFTSLYPHQHGAIAHLSVMRDGLPTLASVLTDNGYATGAIANSTVMKPEFGVEQGFAYYDPAHPEGRLSDGTTRDALAWIEANRSRPFFMFLHYMDPHEPYAPPAPYDTLFDPGYGGRIGSSFVLREDFPNVVSLNFDDLIRAPAEDLNHVIALYDGEIAFADAAVGDLLRGLERLNLRNKTLIVIHSDHGEEFLDHGGFGHGHCLYDEVIKVPLIFWLPGTVKANDKIDRQVRLIDVTPTILDILGIPAEKTFEGVSLAPLLRGKGAVAPGEGKAFPSTIAFTEGILHGDQKKAITAYPWKLISDMVTNEEMLFDLARDPRERDNLILTGPDAYWPLAELMFGTVSKMSDTWYIDIASGPRGNRFDISITAEEGMMIGSIQFYRFLDAHGGLARETPSAVISPSRSRFEIHDLNLTEPLTLAFKVDVPPILPVTFDFRIDGRPATQETYVGDALRRPDTMPFSRRTGGAVARARRARAGEAGPAEPASEPKEKPKPPFLVLRRELGGYDPEKPADLDEETKRQLRALGYIQ